MHTQLQCDHCCSAWHLACLGMKKKDIPMNWSCPQHSCLTCYRKAAAAGGVIFRCISCPNSFCYDHKPGEAVIIAHNPRFEALGYPENQFVCYVHCKSTCQLFPPPLLLLLMMSFLPSFFPHTKYIYQVHLNVRNGRKVSSS